MAHPSGDAIEVESAVSGGAAFSPGERAQAYRLLSHVLATEPTSRDLDVIGALAGDGSSFGRAVAKLAAAARASGAEAARDAFHRLFIGLGAGEVVPYASSYLAGSLHDTPLIELRQRMRELGIRRAIANREPEDHASTILETTAGLIEGSFAGTRADAARMFERHIATWMPRLFSDLRARARILPSPFYSAVADLGLTFIADEQARFGLAAPDGVGP